MQDELRRFRVDNDVRLFRLIRAHGRERRPAEESMAELELMSRHLLGLARWMAQNCPAVAQKHEEDIRLLGERIGEVRAPGVRFGRYARQNQAKLIRHLQRSFFEIERDIRSIHFNEYGLDPV